MYSTTVQYKPMVNNRTRNEETLPMEDLWFVKDNQDADTDKPLGVEESMFPYILVMCGSAFGSLLVRTLNPSTLPYTTKMLPKYFSR